MFSSLSTVSSTEWVLGMVVTPSSFMTISFADVRDPGSIALTSSAASSKYLTTSLIWLPISLDPDDAREQTKT
jgi:hypothetical protein